MSGATPPSKRIVVVIGTHRSGTSLLAQILSHLGVDLGDDLIGPNEFNVDGHWENPEIVRLQERLLKGLRRQWYWQGGSVPLPSGWLDRPATRRCEEELAEVVASRRPGMTRPWGFKDPRTVRLLPLWTRVFSQLGLSPSYVLALRRPDDVAASLFRRDRLPRYAAAMLWLTSMAEAARDAPDAVVVDYDAWFGHERDTVAARVARALQLPADAEAIGRALACVRPELRHVAKDQPAKRSLPSQLADDVFRTLDGVTSLAAAPAPFWHRISEYAYYAELFTHWTRRYDERLSAHQKLESSGLRAARDQEPSSSAPS